METINIDINKRIGHELDEKGRVIEFGIIGANIQKQLDKNPDAKKLILRINSPGGGVHEGNYIYNILDNWKKTTGGQIDAHIEFMCASIATRIAMAANKRYIAKNGRWLAHRAKNGGFGEADDLRLIADELDIIDSGLVSDYKTITKKNKAEIFDLMKQDRELSAAEAIEWGFCDGYLNSSPSNVFQYSEAVACHFSPIAEATAEAMAYEGYITDSLGYKRSEMPQIPFEFFDDFIAYFKAKYGAKVVSTGEMPLGKMLPTQGEFNASKVQDKIASGDWANRNYIISKEKNLLDGHHDWAAGLEADPKTPVAFTKINLPIADLIAEANALKITKQQSVRSKAKNTNEDKIMSKQLIKTNNIFTRMQQAIFKSNPTACADLAPSNMMGTADNGDVVQFDKLEAGGKVEILAADGSVSAPAAGDITITDDMGNAVTVTVDASGIITAVPAAQAAAAVALLEVATAKITELETALAAANANLVTAQATNLDNEAKLTAQGNLYNDLTTKMQAMAALVAPGTVPAGGPQNSGKGTPNKDKNAALTPALDANTIIGRAAASAY